ncbi:MAG: hypothetical protein ABW224_15580 [Kibdelosporangium sp.]
MATAEPENDEKIRELQASLKRVLHHWDTTPADQQTEAFGRVVPVADDLVAAHFKRVRGQAELAARRRRDWLARILLALAAVVLVILVLTGASLWWALVLVPLLGFGLYALITARRTHD